MEFWTALGALCTLFLTLPARRIVLLNGEGWKDLFTTKNACFTTFWLSVLGIATHFGVWLRLWEMLLVDTFNFCGNAPLLCGIPISKIFTAVLVFVLVYVIVTRLGTQQLRGVKWIHRVIRSTISHVDSAYKHTTTRWVLKTLLTFIKQLRLVYFLHQKVDDDGDIMTSEEPVQLFERKKSPKPKFGMPSSIKLQFQQAVELARAADKQSQGSIGKAAGASKKH
ncbi:hypothetical protein WAI453_002791 [Rhynchosporium graminicola]|uniref:Uncharacterized protein n=1 Tax=Rhynchosporium graminicola TaxID=2792576 RepID=A0A1E1JV16_9HELO|nr:uncharacterized protein RCO7_02471 [Rhynchosporium commune]